MGFRIYLSAAFAFAAVALAVGGPVAPAHAAGSDISYNQVTRIIIGGQAPAPGTYGAGSFDADFQAATQKQGGHGLFSMIKNAMSSFHNGFGSTLYYMNNMEREDDLANQTGTITMPDKHQTINLNFTNKTYWINTPSPMRMEQTMPAQPVGPQPKESMAPPQPGTSKLAITIETTGLGSKMLGGVNTDGYQTTFRMVSSQATGSCKNGSFETTMTEFVSSYAEPSLTWPPMPGMMPHPVPPPMAKPEMAAFSPGCVPKITATIHKGPTAPSGRLVMWQMLTINMGAQAPSGPGGGFQTVMERGDVKTLGSSDAGLFGPPPGFTQQQPAQ